MALASVGLESVYPSSVSLATAASSVAQSRARALSRIGPRSYRRSFAAPSAESAELPPLRLRRLPRGDAREMVRGSRIEGLGRRSEGVPRVSVSALTRTGSSSLLERRRGARDERVQRLDRVLRRRLLPERRLEAVARRAPRLERRRRVRRDDPSPAHHYDLRRDRLRLVQRVGGDDRRAPRSVRAANAAQTWARRSLSTPAVGWSTAATPRDPSSPTPALASAKSLRFEGDSDAIGAATAVGASDPGRLRPGTPKNPSGARRRSGRHDAETIRERENRPAALPDDPKSKPSPSPSNPSSQFSSRRRSASSPPRSRSRNPMRLATFLATASGFLAPLNVAAAARCSSGVRLGSKSASSRRHALAPDARSAPNPRRGSTRTDPTPKRTTTRSRRRSECRCHPERRYHSSRRSVLRARRALRSLRGRRTSRRRGEGPRRRRRG